MELLMRGLDMDHNEVVRQKLAEPAVCRGRFSPPDCRGWLPESGHAPSVTRSTPAAPDPSLRGSGRWDMG